MAGRRTKVASVSETSSAGANTFGFYFTSTDAPAATGTFPPYLGIPPFSASRMSTAATGSHIFLSPSWIQTDKSSDQAATPDLSSPHANMQSWGNGTHPSRGFMSFFHNQPNISQHYNFVGTSSHHTPLHANGSSPRLANDGSSVLLATPTPPPLIENQDHVNVDSDDDNGVVRTKLKLNWIQEEDVRLVSAWLNNSMDPINGNDKKAKKYWGDAATEYNKTTPQNRWRSPKQAKERWHKLNTQTDLFQGYGLKAKHTYTSGYFDQMWIEMAHKFYEADNKKLGQFVLIDVWYACRDQPKWNAYNDALKRDRKRKSSDNREMFGQASGPLDVEETPRPIEQKAAKRAARESKGKSNDTSDVEEIDKLNQVQSDIHTRRMKMMEMQEKLSTRQVQSSKLSQLAARENRLAAKDNKDAKMFETYSRLLAQDTTGMADDIRAEHVTAIRCLRKILFPDLS